MERFVAIDSGKYATKVAVYDNKTNTVKMFKFRTKISDGHFADDALEKNTVVMEHDGKIYKVMNVVWGEQRDEKEREYPICTYYLKLIEDEHVC